VATLLIPGVGLVPDDSSLLIPGAGIVQAAASGAVTISPSVGALKFTGGTPGVAQTANQTISP
jgi:hypothetical protein